MRPRGQPRLPLRRLARAFAPSIRLEWVLLMACPRTDKREILPVILLPSRRLAMNGINICRRLNRLRHALRFERFRITVPGPFHKEACGPPDVHRVCTVAAVPQIEGSAPDGPRPGASSR